MPRGLNDLDGRGHAVVALRSLGDAPGFGATRLSGFFGLSPTQGEIALAIFRGKSIEEIAAERGVKITTVRTQLARLYARTGAESQRDLVPPHRASAATPRPMSGRHQAMMVKSWALSSGCPTTTANRYSWPLTKWPLALICPPVGL